MKRDLFARLRVVLAAAVLAAAGWVFAALPPLPEQAKAEYQARRAAVLEQIRTTTRADAPNANTLTIADAQWVEYNADGTDVSWADFWIKALTDVGAQELRSVPIWFKEGYTETEFQLAEIVRADGTVEPLDLSANVSVATSNDSTENNIYDPSAKRLVLTVPRAEKGDTLHVQMAYRTIRPRIPDTFHTRALLESFDGPVPYCELTVVSPKDLPLKSEALLDEVPGTVTRTQVTLKDGRTLRRWVAQDVPQVFAEEKMPSADVSLQRVLVSTFGSWEELSKWYWRLCDKHMATTAAIDAKVKELTEGKTPEQQVEALFAFVAQQVRYMGIIAEQEAPGFEPHDVSLTFDNRYGVCRDKGVLLVAMLRKAGFDAYPVIIHADSPRDREVPMPYFNHAIVAIDQGGRKYRLLDPTDETARAAMPAYLGGCSYLVARPEGETLLEAPVPSPEGNMTEIETAGTLDAAGTLELTATIRFNGVNDNAYRPLFVRAQPAQIRDVFDGFLKRAAPGAELTAVSVSPENAADISKPLVVTVKGRVPHFGTPDAEGHTIVTLPFLSRHLGAVNFLFVGLAQPTRTYDWVIETPCGVRETLTLKGMGALGEAELLPDDPVLKANGASYDVVCRRAENGDLTLTRELVLSHKVYTPEDYRALRRFAERMEKMEMTRPIFSKPGSSDVHAEVLHINNAVTLGEDGSITHRSISDTHILTFQGKRNEGEVKFVINPDVEELILNSVEVKTAKGDRVPLTEKERSDLDVDGSALAARYPALRQTVLSLPAVDVGATVHVDTTRVNRSGKPLCGMVAFGSGTYPTKEERYSITVPAERAADLIVAERNFEGADVERTQREESGKVTYSWVVRNLKAVRGEGAMPEEAFTRPTVHFAMREANPADALKGIIARAEAAIEDLPENVEALAERLAEGLDEEDLEGRLRAVQVHLAKNIRTAGPAWSQLRWGDITPPGTTLADGYGNRLDRLVLRLALLREMDVEAQLVFAAAQDPEYRRLFGTRLALDAVPVWTDWARPYLLLPDGRLLGDEGELDEPGAASISSRELMTAEGIVAYTRPEAMRPRSESTVHVVVNAEGDARISQVTHSWGLAAGSARVTERDLTPEQRRRAIAAMCESLAPGATPDSLYKVDTRAYPVRQSLSVQAKGYAQRRGRLLSIPVQGLLGQVYGLRGVTRESPIWQSEVEGARATLEYWLPPGSEIVSKPEPFVYNLPGGGRYALACTVEVMPHSKFIHVTYVATCVCPPAVLDAWQFSALTELDRLLTAPTMRTLVIRLPE